MSAEASLVAQIARAAARHHLFECGDRVDVALSAGPDSTALLAVLVELAGTLGLELRSHHVRHGLRGDDHEDAAVAAALAARFGVPHLETQLTAADRAGDHGPEANARRARYAALASAAAEAGATRVATGHHVDDALETLLVRLVRGAGLEGLAGMPSRRRLADGVELVRPLLGVRREALARFVATRGLPSATDPTNQRRDALRNRLRLDVVPALAATRRGALKAACRSVALLHEDARALARLAEAVVELGHTTTEPAWYLPIEQLAELGTAASAQVLRHAARRVAPGHTPSSHAIERALSALACWPELGAPPPGRRGLWRDDRVALGREGRHAVVRALDARAPAPPPNDRLVVPAPPGVAANTAWEVRTWLSSGPRCASELEIPTSVAAPSQLAVTAAANLPREATIAPIGMTGHKKVRRVIAELGIPTPWRAHHPVLVDAGGQVVWIVGGPVSTAIAPTMSTVEPTLRIQVTAPGSWFVRT